MAAAVGGGLGLIWLAVMKTAALDAALSRAELGADVALWTALTEKLVSYAEAS